MKSIGALLLKSSDWVYKDNDEYALGDGVDIANRLNEFFKTKSMIVPQWCMDGCKEDSCVITEIMRDECRVQFAIIYFVFPNGDEGMAVQVVPIRATFLEREKVIGFLREFGLGYQYSEYVNADRFRELY